MNEPAARLTGPLELMVGVVSAAESLNIKLPPLVRLTAAVVPLINPVVKVPPTFTVKLFAPSVKVPEVLSKLPALRNARLKGLVWLAPAPETLTEVPKVIPPPCESEPIVKVPAVI